MATEKSREQRLRRLAKKYGMQLRKDRARRITSHHLGGYRLIDKATNETFHGVDYDATLDEVKWLILK
jgi:hypothetical protein